MKLVQTNASVVEDGVNVTLYVHFPGASSYAIADLAVEAYELALLSLKGDADDNGTGADRASDNGSSGGEPDDGDTVNDGDTAGGDPSVDDSPVPVSDGSDSEGRTEEIEFKESTSAVHVDGKSYMVTVLKYSGGAVDIRSNDFPDIEVTALNEEGVGDARNVLIRMIAEHVRQTAEEANPTPAPRRRRRGASTTTTKASPSPEATPEEEQVSDVELTKALNQATAELGMEATKAEIVKRVGAGEKPTISNIPQGARKNLMSALKQMIDNKGNAAPAAPAAPRRGRRR